MLPPATSLANPCFTAFTRRLCRGAPLTLHADRSFQYAVFSPDGRWIVATTSDAVSLFDARTGEEQWFAAGFHLGRLLLESPGNADLLCRRARAYTAQKRYKEARADCDEAIRLQPKSVEAWLTRGLLEEISPTPAGRWPARASTAQTSPPSEDSQVSLSPTRSRARDIRPTRAIVPAVLAEAAYRYVCDATR